MANWQLFPTIQDAIDSGASVVDICPGQHQEQLQASNVELRSASGDASDTVLSGEGVRSILGGDHLTLVGLSFVDGVSDYAGGAVEVSDVEIACSVFEDNVADYQGGALQIRGDAQIEGSVFLNNHAHYEGGAISWGDWADGELVVRGSIFEGNTADYSGAAIEIGTWAYDTVSITDSTFLDNHDDYGIGVVAFGSWGGFDGTIESCVFEGNDQAIGLNGWLEDGYTLEVVDTTIVGDPGNY